MAMAAVVVLSRAMIVAGDQVTGQPLGGNYNVYSSRSTVWRPNVNYPYLSCFTI